MLRGPDRVFDEYLVTSSQAGSRAAFDALARRWTPRLLRYAARTLGPGRDSTERVRDVVQETWLGAIRGLNRLEDPAQFAAWIYGIARRKCVDAIRKNVHRRQMDAHLQAVVEPCTGDADIARERSLDLAGAIDRLTDDQRAVVHLFYGEDLTVAETAAALAIPPGTVKSRLFHARDALKGYLEPFSSMSQHREDTT